MISGQKFAMIIAGTIVRLPIYIWQRKGRPVVKVTDNPFYRMIRDLPAPTHVDNKDDFNDMVDHD